MFPTEEGWSTFANGLTAYVPSKLGEAGLHAEAKATRDDWAKGMATLSVKFKGQEADDHLPSASPAFKEASNELFRHLNHMGLALQALQVNEQIQREARQGSVITLVKEKLNTEGVDAAVLPATPATSEDRETAAEAQADTKVGNIVLRVHVDDPAGLDLAKNGIYEALASAMQELLGKHVAFNVRDEVDADAKAFRIFVSVTEFDYLSMLSEKKGQSFADDFAAALRALQRLEGMGLGAKGAALREIRVALDAQVMPALPAELAKKLRRQAGVDVEVASASSMAS
jgi:hypothetical protein